MTNSEREELTDLRRQMNVSSLGDKPFSIAADKLRRLIELEGLDKIPVIVKSYQFKCCGVSSHKFSIIIKEDFKISTVVFCPLWGCNRQAFPETTEEDIVTP